MRALLTILSLPLATWALNVVGNDAFPASAIEEAAYAGGSFDADAVRQLYLRAGYLDVKLTVTAEPVYPTLRIAEGNRYRLNRVAVTNLTPLTSKELRSYLRAEGGGPASPLAVREDLVALLRYLARRGYLDATAHYEFTPRGPYLFDLTVTLTAGDRFLVGDVTLIGPSAKEREEITARWNVRPGSPLRETDLAADLLTTIDYYRERGYAAATARPRRFRLVAEAKEVDFDVWVEPGDLTAIGYVDIRGNRRTRDYVIRRELTFYPGDPYDVGEIRRSARAVYNLTYFEDTPDIAGREDGKGEMTVTVGERRTYRATGALTYEPAEEEKPTALIGELRSSFYNVAGTGRNVDASYRSLAGYDLDAYAKYYEPWIGGVDLFAQPEGYRRERKDYAATGAEAAVGTHPALDLTVATGVGFDRAWRANASRKVKGFAWAIWDTRDFYGNPRRGWRVRARVELGIKDYFKDGWRERIPKIEVDGWRFWPTARAQVLAARVRFAGYRSRRDAADECYPLGGFSDLRGYRDEHFLTDRHALATLEYRFLTAKESRVFAFGDAAYHHRRRETARLEGFAIGYGVGFRARTAVGEYGVDYGLARGLPPWEGKIHVSLTQEF